MKRILCLITALLLFLVFSGCEVQETFDDFSTYIGSEKQKLPSGCELLTSMNLEQDKDGHFTVLSFMPCFSSVENGEYHSDIYKWFTLSLEQQIEDFKYCAGLVEEYAAYREWGDYFLFVTADIAYFKSVYIPEENTLYYTKGMSVYFDMYRQFGTMDAEDLADDEAGRAFLVSHNLADQKYDTIENIKSPDLVFYYVSIHDGELLEFGKEQAGVFKP
jgi:hypothetical protein